MARMRCRCGHEVRLTGVNSPYEFSLVPEYTIENIAEKIEQGKMSMARGECIFRWLCQWP